MKFKHWLNELVRGPHRHMVEDAMQQIWRVIVIPENLAVPVQEAVVEWDMVKSLFASTSNNDFYRWLSTYAPSFEPGAMPEKVTKGYMGTAAFFGDRVFKFTSQGSEAAIAALLKDHNIPQVAILDIVRIPKFGVYCIAQERVQTTNIPQELMTAANIVGDYLDMYAQTTTRPKSPFGQGVQPVAQKATQRFLRDIDNRPLNAAIPQTSFVVHAYVEILLQIIEQIEKKTGRVYLDSGEKNVGLKNNQPALFDLGGNYVSRSKQIPRIRDV